MKKIKNLQHGDKLLNDSERRRFMEKFGKLTGAIPAGMLVLMSPGQSRANSSTGDANDTTDTNDGFSENAP
ncbi:MAG: hypothetical protein GXO33_06720 [Epsilonproteobacteria bacterium]|nr:hypothetical protein [Campylobacterota bacterium]